MNKVLNLYKKSGETPLECILRFKKTHQEYSNLPMTYAGRLDPLAEGVLIVLAGEDVHNKEEYLSLKKEYEVEVLFGFETDTYDVLGIPLSFSCTHGNPSAEFMTWISASEDDNTDKNKVEKALKKFIGKNIFKYPSYSSKTINGKPLFSIARAGELDEIEIPKREMDIHNLEILGSREMSSKDLLKEIERKINEVKGDFRQDLCISKWREILENLDQNFLIIKIRAEVSSGTYMRTLAHEWGKSLGVPALAYHIVRKKVGDYYIDDSISNI